VISECEEYHGYGKYPGKKEYVFRKKLLKIKNYFVIIPCLLVMGIKKSG